MAAKADLDDAAKLVAWLREAANELEQAHLLLDKYVPRANDDHTPYTLAARIALLADLAP